MSWTILKAAIAAAIKTNNNQEITGAVLQNTLNSIVNSVGANATFAGIATPSTNPGTPDGPVFWIAGEGGQYSNFGNITLPDGISILKQNGNTWIGENIISVSLVYDEIRRLIENYKPIIINGDVTNAPDEEDLTTVNDLLKFKDKSYNPIVFSGLGRKYLRKNIVDNINVLTQDMISEENTVYIIQYDYELAEDITIPANCVLEFEGGAISGNNNLVFNNTKLKGDIRFNGIIPSGLISTDFIYVDWFGLDNTGETDCTSVLQKIANWAVAIAVPVKFGYGTYKITDTILFQNSSWKFRGIYGAESVTTIRLDSSNDIPAILVVNGSGKESKSIIENFLFESNGIEHNTLLELRGCNQVHIKNCYFYKARYGVKFSNDVESGTFTEGNTIDECRFASNCGTALWYYRGAGDRSFHGSGIKSAWIDTAIGYNTIIIDSGAFLYNAPLTCQILKLNTTEAEAPLILNNGEEATCYGTITIESPIAVCGGNKTIRYRGDIIMLGAVSHGTLMPVLAAGKLGSLGGNMTVNEFLPVFTKYELSSGETVSLRANSRLYLCSFTASNGVEMFFILGGTGTRYNSSPTRWAPIFCSDNIRSYLEITQGNDTFVVEAKTSLTLYTKIIATFATYNTYARYIQ